ncbi:MAG TPA: hypothetical protein VGJ39_04100 [Vicinamibacterales bacterium]|jgi:hypothetical protein
MTRDEWVRVKEIAAEALARPEVDRAAYVAARCGQNDLLCHEVQSLLDSVAKATGLYETLEFTRAGALGR